jgi:hypothetical protein
MTARPGIGASGSAPARPASRAESPAPGLPPHENLDSNEPPHSVDYGAINATYALLLTGLVVAARRREEPTIDNSELFRIAAATFALSKTVARERIGSWVRGPFVDEERGRRPQGRRLRYAIGELVTCTRCVGAWSSLALVGLRVASPVAGRTVTNVLAAAALNDFLQAAFRALCEQADRSAPT